MMDPGISRGTLGLVIGVVLYLGIVLLLAAADEAERWRRDRHDRSSR